MKKGLHRIVIPTLSICLGAAIVGSISGTVAWYQYSTRVSAAYLGTSAGTAGNLKLRIKGTNTDTDDKWTTSLTHDAISDYLAHEGIGQEILPITGGNIGEDDAIKTYNAAADPDNDPADMKPLFYKNPVRSYTENVPYGDSWIKADESMYVQIPLELCFIEYDGKPTSSTNNVDKEYLKKDVYISDLLIKEDYQNTAGDNNFVDLSSAVRVHVSSSYKEEDDQGQLVSKTKDKLISKNGGTVLTRGYLDLDGIDGDDTVTTGSDSGAAYGFGEDIEVKKVVYGEGTQKAYKAATVGDPDATYTDLDNTVKADPIYPAVVKSINNSAVLDKNDFTFNKGDVKASKLIGKTIAYNADDPDFEQEEQEYLEIVLTIWLEGWQTLPVSTSNPDEVSSIWNADNYIGSMFDVGIQFATQAE